jgi:glycosyltransferase involved in cell wall biosynthesis
MIDGRLRIAAAIPAYQAAASIGQVAARTSAFVETTLVVDDGSSDATGEAARRAGAEVLALPRNMGKGRCLESAFKALFARGFDAVVTLDADGQHIPEEIPALIGVFAQGADLVLGVRHHDFAAMSVVRRVSNTASSWAISRLAGADLPDVQTGFRLYSRRLVEAVGFPEPRFEAESAVVVRAARAGFGIRLAPVRTGFADGRATSHYRPILDGLRIARAVILARLERPARAPSRRIA